MQCYRPDCTGGLIGRPREYILHLHNAHKEDHEWFCHLCEIAFLTVSDLMNHQGAHHSTTPWCSDRHFSTRMKVEGGKAPIRWKSKPGENADSDLVGAKYFVDGEDGCICKSFNPLYPWLGMVEAGLTVPLVNKTEKHAVIVKRK